MLFLPFSISLWKALFKNALTAKLWGRWQQTTESFFVNGLVLGNPGL